MCLPIPGRIFCCLSPCVLSRAPLRRFCFRLPARLLLNSLTRCFSLTLRLLTSALFLCRKLTRFLCGLASRLFLLSLQSQLFCHAESRGLFLCLASRFLFRFYPGLFLCAQSFFFGALACFLLLTTARFFSRTPLRLFFSLTLRLLASALLFSRTQARSLCFCPLPRLLFGALA